MSKRVTNFATSSEEQKVLSTAANQHGSGTIVINPLITKLKARLSETDSSLCPKPKELDKGKALCTHNNIECSVELHGLNKEKDENRLEQPFDASKKLILEVIEKGAIAQGTIIHIDSEGLVRSNRNVKDGIAYFGSEAPGVAFTLPLGRLPAERLRGHGQRQRSRPTLLLY
eukprot:TRINITY_DN3391_c0_g3_i1.p1 TRINITY_DN3391_c0_g3~~TRINITY_DN3391_c0_g3_i1.p1  ORF type:complete len:172 (+),score=21.55 TRINITY_DN3391_c0_g3_i1:259-774(+)